MEGALVIKQIWSGENKKFDEEVMKGARVIKEMWSGDKTSLIKR